VALYCDAPWCSYREATSEVGEEEMPPSPYWMIEANANIRGMRAWNASARVIVPCPRLSGHLLLL
jgi:hypothetical protein